MRISEVELHQFTYALEDVGVANGHQVYDPGTTLDQPGFILTIRTADGLEGHYRGIIFVPPMVTQVEMAASGVLIGRNPLEREGIWQQLWRAFRHTDHLGLGPIDVALWDLAGRHYGASVAELLGGYRDTIPAYASTFFMDTAPDGLNSPEAYSAYAESCHAAGYTGFKIHGHPAGDPTADIAVCEAVAESVGGDLDLMLDPASEYRTFGDALRVGRVLDDLGFFWYEDPLADTGQSAHATRRLTSHLDTPILGLEHVRSGPFGRADHAASEAAEFIRADVHLDGGITGAMKIAHSTEALGLDVEFHLGGPATVHCLSAIRNTNFYEHALVHPQGVDWMTAQAYADGPERVTDGRVHVPTGDGLGFEVDWGFVEDRLTDRIVIDQAGTSGLS